MSGPLKYREVSRELLAEIGSGKFSATGRLPSEAQLVQRFKVSRPTIIRALQDLQQQEVIERRAGSGTYIRSLKNKPLVGNQLGLLIPRRGSTEIFEQISGELASLARAKERILLLGGSDILFVNENLTAQEAFKLTDHLIEQRVSGVFFAPFEFADDHEEVNRNIAERFFQAGISVVLLDRDWAPFPRRSNFDVVGVDNFAAGFLVAEHLIKLGCQHLAWIARPHSAATVEARIAGTRESCIRHNLDLPRDWINTGDPEDLKFVRRLVSARRWDAAICANDWTAAQLLRSLEKCHMRVPQDIRVVGFDDAKYATIVSVPLTTIRQSCRDIAITAFSAMMERIAEPTRPPRLLLLTPELIVRESCGAYLH
jgi:DNA-binding LacI/PurR family transcriptional regulator